MNNQINIDRCGNPVYKKSIKDIIIAFGAKFNADTNQWEIPNDESLLSICPVLYEEDEYGLATNNEYISQIDIDRIGQTCSMWRDKQLDNWELYAETGLMPNSKFEIQGKEYTLVEIKLDKNNKPIAYCTTLDTCSNELIESAKYKLVDLELEFVLDNMNKYKYVAFDNLYLFI